MNTKITFPKPSAGLSIYEVAEVFNKSDVIFRSQEIEEIVLY